MLKSRAEARDGTNVTTMAGTHALFSHIIHHFGIHGVRTQVVRHITMQALRQAADQTKVLVKLPPKWVNMYGDFITKNAGAVGQVEGALRSLTYILPGTSSVKVWRG